MTEHKNIASALAAAQQDMEGAKKSSNNPHFRTKYADLGAVCEAVIPALNAVGIAVVQPVEQWADDLAVVTRFIHGASGETLETPMPLLLGKRDMQGLGSAITYARRYGLMTLAGIAPEDDDGNAAAASGPAPKRQPAPAIDQEAINIAKESMSNAESLEALRDIFTGLPKDVQRFAGVIAAKDDRKAALEDAAHDAAVKEGNA